jgi:hypothetical protein
MDIQLSIEDGLTYTDLVNRGVTFGRILSSPHTEIYSPKDFIIAQTFKHTLVNIKSTRAKTAAFANTSNYSDTIDIDVTTEGTKVILVEILTNSSYRG